MVKVIGKGVAIPEWLNKVTRGRCTMKTGQTLLVARYKGDLHVWGFGNGRSLMIIDDIQTREIVEIQGDPNGGGIVIWRMSIWRQLFCLPTTIIRAVF